MTQNIFSFQTPVDYSHSGMQALQFGDSYSGGTLNKMKTYGSSMHFWADNL